MGCSSKDMCTQQKMCKNKQNGDPFAVGSDNRMKGSPRAEIRSTKSVFCDICQVYGGYIRISLVLALCPTHNVGLCDECGIVHISS